MLVLSRKIKESVIIGRESDLSILMEVTVLEISKGRVTLGFSCDDHIPIHRKEVWEKICGKISSTDPLKDFLESFKDDTDCVLAEN